MLQYDDDNRLTTNWVAGVWKAEHVYDGLSRRRIERNYTWHSAIGNWQLTNEVHFLYDGKVVIQERTYAPQLSTTIPQQCVSYIRGRDLSGSFQGAGGIGGLLARTEQPAAGIGHPASALYHADGHGNITCLSDTNGLVQAAYQYDPYGNTLSERGPLASANRYRFSSKPIHLPSGMYDYLSRWYLPVYQRWITRDAIAETGGLNLFEFSGNCPSLNVDPDGAESKAWDDFWRDDLGRNPIAGDQIERGCIGLCAWWQCEGTGTKPQNFPENAKNTTCFMERKEAEAYKCPEKTTRFMFAKQGSWNGGKPAIPGAGGVLPDNNCVDGGPSMTDYNYVSCKDGKWYWMNGSTEITTRIDRNFLPRVYWEPTPPPRGQFAAEIWCVTCKKLKK